MRKLIAALAVASLLGAIALGASIATGSSISAAAKTRTVTVADEEFSPTKITIHKRDIIKWIWVDANGNPGSTLDTHTVTERDNRFTSPEQTEGSYKKRFKRVGTVRIICSTHPTTMRMKVVVKE